MDNEAPVTPSSNLNDLSKGTPVTGHVETHSDSIDSAQNIEGDVVYGNKVTGDQITAEVGAGAQNIVVGSGNTQIIGYTAEQVAVIITQIRRADQPKGWNGRTPYIGLDSFSEQQVHLFFGREKLIAHLLTRVQENRFLCITGPSGSGKSSLVQAGLIPALRAGQLIGSEQWLFETVQPGNQPLENLALTMGRLAKSPTAAEYFRTHSATNPLTLHSQIETMLSHQLHQRAVIVVDQFEEIFTQTKDEVLRLTFLALLTYAVQRADGRVSVLLTMRSDFVSQCATYADLRQLISGHLELVGAMEPEELARAIVMPALEVGVEVKPDLVAQVINDMRGEPGALPLMQFALKDLFDTQPKQLGKPVVLTLQEYLTRGGIQQALERHANAQFDKFLPEEQEIARKIFMSLIEVGHGTVDTRRTAAFRELLPPGVDATQVERVVQTLANARLITTDNSRLERDTATGDDTRNVTIAHEKLIEAWPWLQQMVRENRALIELQNQISEDAAQWVEHKYDAGYLYTGARLQTAKEQLATNQLTLNALAQQLIDASKEAETERLQKIEAERQRELDHQRQLADEQRQRADDREHANARLRNRARLLAGLGLLALLLAATASWFGIQSNRNATAARNERTTAQAASTAALEQQAIAEVEKGRADQKAQEAQEAAAAQATEVINRSNAQAIALSRQLATQSKNELSKNHYELAILLAIEAGRVADTLESFAVIRAAIASPWHSRFVFYGDRSTAWSAVWNRDESKLLTNGGDTLRIWDAATGHELVKFTLKGVNSAVWNKDESKILTSSADDTLRILDATTGHELVKLVGHTDGVTSAIWNKDESKLLSNSYDSTVRIWNAATGHELVKFTLTGVNSAVWNKDESKILTRSYDNTIRIWNAATGHELVKFTLTGVNSAVWNKDESKILTSSSDGTLRIWDAAIGKELVKLTAHPDAIASAVWSKDESKILTRSYDGEFAVNGDRTVRILDTTTGRELVKLTLTGVNSAVWSKDESKILTSSADTVRIWDAATGHELVKLTLTGVNSAVWSKDESKILTSSSDGTIRILDATPGSELVKFVGHTAGVTSAIWSKDESKLLSSSADGTVRIWDTATGHELVKFIGHTGIVDSALWSKNESKILTSSYDSEAGGRDNTVRIWDAATGHELVKLTLTSVTSAVWNKDESKILTSNADSTVHIWDAATGRELVNFAGHTGALLSAAWSKNESKILTSSYNGAVSIWDAATGKELVKFTGHTGYVYSAVWSKDESKILTNGGDTIRIWDAATGYELVKLNSQIGTLLPDVWNSALWNKDEGKILTSSYAGTVSIWDAATGKELVKFTGHAGTINSAVWNKDESKLLTSSADGTVSIWDAATGHKLVEFTDHTGAVASAVWSKDESKLLSSGADGTIRIWYTHMADLLSAACAWTPRNLTQDEWAAYMQGNYAPTCPNAPIPPNASEAIKAETIEQIRSG